MSLTKRNGVNSLEDLIPRRSRIDAHAFLILSARLAAEKSGDVILLELVELVGAVTGKLP